jgi:predicted DNA-binding protein with PD1-like motif/glutaredoxin
MHTLPLHLEAGSDVRQSLEALAREQGATGYVLSVVGNLSAAVFQCPGKPAPTRLRGELEIITLSGTLSPEGVHLHLSFSDGDCRVWGGHLEPGTLVLRGADLLVGFLPVAAPVSPSPAPDERGRLNAGASAASAQPPARPSGRNRPAVRQTAVSQTAASQAAAGEGAQPRLEIAVLPGCPWSARALRMLRTLSIPHRVIRVESDAVRGEIQQRSGSSSLPQVFVDGEPIGGYDALAESHGRKELEPLRLG